MSVASVKFKLADGSFIDLVYNASTGKYEGTATAPSVTSWNKENHKYGAVVQATDNAGNVTTVDRTDETLGASLQLRVLEKTAPTIVIVTPAASAYITEGTPTFQFKIKDADSGLDTTTLKLVLDGTEITTGFNISSEPDEDGFYTVEYTPATALAEGSHSYTISVDDNDGNTGTSAETSFTVDTVDPELNISAPEDGAVVNTDTITVVGTTSDATSGPVTVTVNGEAVTVDEDGSFSKVVNLSEGNNTITVVATDAAGRSTTITRTVVKNTSAPTIVSVVLTPNPADCGATYTIAVEVTDE